MANIVDPKDLHRICLTAIVYNDDGKYLITKRSPNHHTFPGKWEVPGGGVELKDYINLPKTTDTAWYRVLENSLKREVKEETNLEIDKIEYLLDLTFIRPDGIPVLVLSYFAHTPGGEVVLEEDGATEYAWVSIEEARKYDLIGGVLEEIEEADKIIRSRKKINYMENNKYWFFGSKLNTVLLLVLIILMVIALKFMWANKEYYKESIGLTPQNTNTSQNFQLIQTKDFSFTTLSGLIASPTDFDGCPWFFVSVPNDGHMTKGEVGIYPMDCYDLTKTGGQKEYIQKDGYYIVHHFDDSMTEGEIKFSRSVYQKIIDTFTLNKN